MNFLNPFVKFKIIFFILLIQTLSGITSALSAKYHSGTPLIQNFEPDFLYNSPPNYSMVFDHSGILFLGQENRISIFNGSSWEYIHSEGENFLCVNKANTVFFAGNKNLGFLAPDSSNKIASRSIRDKLPPKYQNYTRINGIASTGNNVFFHIDNSLLSFDSGEFKVLEENFNSGQIFNADDKLLCLTQGKYITIYDEDIISGKFKCETDNISYILYEKNGFILFDKSNFLYKTDQFFNVLYKIHPESVNSVTQGIALDNGEILLSDAGNSLVIIDSACKIKSELDEVPEFPKSKVLGLTRDSNGGIWILQEKSISFLNYPFSIHKIKNIPSEYGVIHDIKSFCNELFLATTKGIFCLEKNTSLPAPLATTVFYYNLFTGPDDLFAASSNTIVLIRDRSVKTIYKGKILDISIDLKFNILYIASPDGISVIHLKNHEIDRQYFLQTGFQPLKLLHSGNIFWSTDGSILYRINLTNPENRDEQKIMVLRDNQIKDLFIWKNNLNIISPDKILKYDTLTSGLSPVNSNFGFTDEFITILDEIPGNIILITKNTRNKYIFWYADSQSDSLQSFYIPNSVYTSNPSFDLLSPFNLVVSTGSDIYTVDLNLYFSGKCYFKTYIDAIFAGRDTIFEGLSYDFFRFHLSENLDNISFRKRNLRIALSSSNYFDDHVQFQYILEGKEKSWSEWSELSFINLKNLHEGRYKLNIRSKNSNGNISEPTTLNFRILTPPYRSISAIIIYIIILSILLFIFYKSTRHSLHKVHTVKHPYIGTPKENIIESKIDLQPDSMKKPELDFFFDSERGRGRARWDKYEMVTVLFSDIQGFTKIAESMNPELLIDELDKFFYHFDSVVEKYNIEKIKTIGDAYMAAGGIPKKNYCNPIEVVLAALEMLQYMKQLKNTKVDIWDLRIGIHSGPVIAGIVGQKKRSYDIWGDTVNTASRMESSGEAGKINISGTTYDLVKDFFICEYRGKLPVKYKGNIDMYFVKSIRPELSINLGGLPNRKFFTKLQILRIRDLENMIFTKLEIEIPKNLFFHNLEFIKHQYQYAVLLTKAENLDTDESIIILTSALLMNIGYIESYENYENKSAEFARMVLPEYKYSDKQIVTISNLILATKWPPNPQSLYEKILFDIKMEYLGRSDYLKLYKLLFLEQNQYIKGITIRDFKEDQLKILMEYNFYTSSARRFCEISKLEQLKKVREDNWE